MSIEKNIKELREKHNLTQKEFAQIAGVTDKAVSMWEQGKRDPRMGAIKKISDFFKIRISDILGEENEDFVGSDMSKINIPILKTMPFSYDEILKKDILGYKQIEKKKLAVGEKYIYFKVTDKKMSPFFLEDDIILVHLKNFINSGDYGFISVNKEKPFLCKILYYGDRVELLFENKKYNKLTFEKSEFSELKVLGEAKKLIRTL